VAKKVRLKVRFSVRRGCSNAEFEVGKLVMDAVKRSGCEMGLGEGTLVVCGDCAAELQLLSYEDECEFIAYVDEADPDDLNDCEKVIRTAVEELIKWLGT